MDSSPVPKNLPATSTVKGGVQGSSIKGVVEGSTIKDGVQGSTVKDGVQGSTVKGGVQGKGGAKSGNKNKASKSEGRTTPSYGSYSDLQKQHMPRKHKSKNQALEQNHYCLPDETNVPSSLSLTVSGFPLNASTEDIQQFFLFMYLFQDITLQKDQGTFNGCVQVTFINIEDYRDFLSRDMILYDDTELQFTPSIPNKGHFREDETSCSNIVQIPGAVLCLTSSDSSDSRPRFSSLKQFFRENTKTKMPYIDFDYNNSNRVYVRFHVENMAWNVYRELFEENSGAIKIDGLTLQGRVLEGQEEFEHWKRLMDMKSERKEKKEQKKSKNASKVSTGSAERGKDPTTIECRQDNGAIPKRTTKSNNVQRPQSGNPGKIQEKEKMQDKQKLKTESASRMDGQMGQTEQGQCQKRTPKGKGNRGKDQHKKDRKIFEPYWSKEDVSAGLKRGQLLQGPLRINPRNYEECYIPHPNGVSDIFISGMKNRNRALNGDIVAVVLLDQDQWRVNEDYVKRLEEDNQTEDSRGSPQNAEKDGDIERCCESSRDGDIQVVTMETTGAGSKEKDNISEDSEPDVIVEEEEVIIINSKSQKETSLIQTVSKQMSTVSIQDSQTAGSTGKRSERMEGEKPDNQKEEKDKKGKGTPRGTPQKKYTSVDDMVKGGSPVVKKLFQNGQMEESRNSNRIIQRTAKVIAIIEPKHSRACTGHIKPMQDGNKNWALFCPSDNRVPRIMVPVSDCPKDFLERPDDHAKTLYICRFEWKETSMMAHGNLKRSLGEAGQIEPETEGMLIENDVDYSEFSDEAVNSLPIQNLPWQIPPEEYEKRRDFRQQCVFTIDPATARDLDDALSIEVIDDDLFEVGVHIADVSYFLQEGTALDKVAGQRATSVYLVQKVIPMLPRILCEQLCSLNPDEDRLTFSVVWKMNSKGEVFEEWFGRSVIKSCCKLSYDHAQGFIENPDKTWTTEELPRISDGFSVVDIKDRVLRLQKIAVNLRKARFDNGALRLDQVKLQFTLDKETMMPNGYSVYEQRDSNRLVEEFMLLANMAVAHKIYSTFPEKALLRRHPPPQSKMADDLSDLCQNLGVPIDISSAASLQQTIWRYLGEDEHSKARMQVLVSLCSKPMQNAKYFCTGCLDDEEMYHHYALSVPLYTHFTSPIRRYADVVVHRTLTAALGYCPETSKLKQEIQGQAETCNDKKTNSKRVQDLSSELFFSIFVKEAGPFEEKAMVMGVLDKAFDIFVLKLGVTKRVYCNKLDLKDKQFVKEQKLPVLTLTWNPVGDSKEIVSQRITIFTVVNCIIQAGELPLQWVATIRHPKSITDS